MDTDVLLNNCLLLVVNAKHLLEEARMVIFLYLSLTSYSNLVVFQVMDADIFAEY